MTVLPDRDVSQRQRPAGLILLYHRVDVLACDPWGLAVRPEHFAQHLQCLRKFGHPTPLREIAASLQRNELSDCAIAITFDDGYADNLHNAAPLLARHGVPATVFVATGYIASGREFWWDELERVLLTPPELPGELHLCADEQSAVWPLGDARRYTEEERRADRVWFSNKRGATSPRFAFFRSTHGRLMSMSESKRRAALDQIIAWACDAGAARPSYLCVSREEAVALDKLDHIELGAHTVTHSALTTLPAGLQTQEMRQSKEHLEALTGRTVSSFAYPYGLYSAETSKLAQDEGFVTACSTKPDTVVHDTDVFSLPRIKVGDWEGERFEKMLAAWLSPLP